MITVLRVASSFTPRLSLWVGVIGLVLLTHWLTAPPRAQAASGSATTSATLTVPVATTVSCSSTTVTAAAGNQSTTLTVTCILTGNPSQLASGTANAFMYPATLTNGANSLAVTPVATVTSPDGSINSILGSASGFSGVLASGTGNTWRIRSSCTVATTATTRSGTYTGTVQYVWSTL